MNDTNRLGALVFALREKAGVSQSQLAAAAGIDPKTVNRVENGTGGKTRDLKTIRALAQGLSRALGENESEIFAQLSEANGFVESRVVREDHDNAAWAQAVDEYLQTDLGSDTSPEIAEQLRQVDHKSFRLRASVKRDIHRARELLEVQEREFANEGARRPPVDEQGFGLGRPRPRKR